MLQFNANSHRRALIRSKLTANTYPKDRNSELHKMFGEKEMQTILGYSKPIAPKERPFSNMEQVLKDTIASGEVLILKSPAEVRRAIKHAKKLGLPHSHIQTWKQFMEGNNHEKGIKGYYLQGYSKMKYLDSEKP